MRLEVLKKIDPLSFHQVRKSKIYVDEVQDYTQIECLAFFYLADLVGSFLPVTQVRVNAYLIVPIFV